MKQLLFGGLLLTIIVPLLLVGQPVSAAAPVDVLNSGQGPCNNPNAQGTPAICGDATTPGKDPIFGSDGIVTVIVKILSLIAGVIAVIFIIIQAIKMAASGGDPQAVASARGGLMYALIGLAVAVMAQTLVYLVLSRIT